MLRETINETYFYQFINTLNENWPKLVGPVRVPSMGQINLFENYLCLIGILDNKTMYKKTLELRKKCEYKLLKYTIP